MSPQFEKVTTSNQIIRVVRLAHTIWNEHFPQVISQAQIDYMVEHFQSKTAITAQIQQGLTYTLITNAGQDAGYYAIQSQDSERLFLSKFYLLSGVRGQGLARQSLQDIERQARARGHRLLTLTCNKRNTLPIAIYEHLGFVKTESIIMDIGEGFVMDDYRMEKVLT